MNNPITDILKLSHELVAAITRDDCGQMIGQIWMGGNGGLLSRETLKVADSLRLALASANDANLHLSASANLQTPPSANLQNSEQAAVPNE